MGRSQSLDTGNDALVIQENASNQTYEYPTSWKLVFILLSLVLGSLLVAIDTTIISVAIPQISTDFKALNDVGWYGSAYLVTLTAFQPTVGNVYKLFSPKIAYIVSIVVFEVGSTICAAAPTSSIFIAGRAIAGIGAAGLIQGALAIVTYIAPLEKRPMFIGLVVSVFGISACGGPILGGVLTDRVGWRWCFWVNVPMGAAILTLVIFSLKLKGTQNPMQRLPIRSKLQHMDPLGIILLLGAVCCLLLVLQQGGNAWPWNSSKVICLLVGFVVLSLLFGLWQYRLGDMATIPLRILRNRTVLMGSLFLALSNSSSYVKLYYLPFYFQAVQGSSAIRSGVQFVSLALPQMVSSVVTSALIQTTGYYVPFMMLGQVVGAVGTGLLTTIGLNTTTLAWATFMVLAGWGTGMGENTPYIAIQAVMEKEEDVFIGNGVATFFALLGGSIAISIGQSLLINGLNTEVPQYTGAVTSQAVIEAGALNLPSLTTSATVLLSLQEAYAKVISNIMIFSLVIVCIGFPVVCGMKWLNLKKLTAERQRDQRLSAAYEPNTLSGYTQSSIAESMPDQEKDIQRIEQWFQDGEFGRNSIWGAELVKEMWMV